MKAYSPYDNVRAARLPGDARHRGPQRSARAVLGTGEVGREAAGRVDLGATDHPAHRARRRPRRPVGPLRRVARGSDGPRVRVRRGRRRRHDRRRPRVPAHRPTASRSRPEYAPPRRRPSRGTVVLCHPASAVRRHDAQHRRVRRCSTPCPRRATAACASTSAASRAARGARRRARRARRRPRRARRSDRPRPSTARIALVGWSFGADMALSVADPRVDGWVGIAPPLRFGTAFDAVAQDPRPKHLVLAQHDEFRDPADVQREVASWTNVTTEVVSGRQSLLRRPHRPRGRGDRGIPRVADARVNR